MKGGIRHGLCPLTPPRAKLRHLQHRKDGCEGLGSQSPQQRPALGTGKGSGIRRALAARHQLRQVAPAGSGEGGGAGALGTE